MDIHAKDLALGWLTVGGSDPFRWLSAASAGGFGSVGLKVAPRPGEESPVLLENAAVRAAFQAQCRDQGIGILNMGSIWLDGEKPVQEYAHALDVGAHLGAQYVVGISIDPVPTRRAAHMVQLADMARERGLKPTIEFFAYSQVPGFGDALALCEQAGDDGPGVLFDALHFHRAGGVLSQLTPENVQRIDYFQICDAPHDLPAGMSLSEEGRSARLFPGEGDIPLKQLLAAMPAPMRIEVEIPHRSLNGLSPAQCGREAMQRTMRFLHSRAQTVQHTG